MEEYELFPLHKCIFEGNCKLLTEMVQKPPSSWNLAEEVCRRDIHGNTPLHLAVMLGRKDCVLLLLAYDAPVDVKNNEGWNCLAEAISYGERSTITTVLRKLKQQSRKHVQQHRANLVRGLHKMRDFYMELKWEFSTWVPLVSRILPSDVCRIHKKGASLRLDTSLADFSEMSWERGDLSLIFRSDQPAEKALVVLNNQRRDYAYLNIEKEDEYDADLDDEVDALMSTDILSVQLSTKGVEFCHSRSGWIFREDRTELVGCFNCQLYSLHGLILRQLKRREHLSRDDVQQNRAMLHAISRGNPTVIRQLENRRSLPPPSPPNVTWDEYINTPEGECPKLGRPLVCKMTNKPLRATVSMCDEFPLSLEMLLQMLEVVVSFKHLSKLREFINSKLPPGFPVKIEMPLIHTVTARVTFQKFEFLDDIPQTLFAVPPQYKNETDVF